MRGLGLSEIHTVLAHYKCFLYLKNMEFKKCVYCLSHFSNCVVENYFMFFLALNQQFIFSSSSFILLQEKSLRLMQEHFVYCKLQRSAPSCRGKQLLGVWRHKIWVKICWNCSAPFKKRRVILSENMSKPKRVESSQFTTRNKAAQGLSHIIIS